MMAHGGLIPGYQEGGSTSGSGLGRLLTGAGSWEEARENPWRTGAHTALTGAMFIPGVGLVGAGGRLALGLAKGARATRGLSGLGKFATGLEAKGGLRGMFGRTLGARPPVSKLEGPRRWARKPPYGPRLDPQLDLFKKNPKYPWVNQLSPAQNAARRALAGERFRGMPTQVGKRVLLRGGAGLGIAGLLALDPFDAGEEGDTTGFPEINTDLTRSPAIRADRSKGFGNGGFDWLSDETQAERDLRELMAYRSASDFGDEYTSADEFQDRANQAWMARRNRQDFSDIDVMDSARQGFADLPGMASGGLIPGYQIGGGIGDPPSSWSIPDPRGYEGGHQDWMSLRASQAAATEERREGVPRRLYEEYLTNRVDPDYSKALSYEGWLRENPAKPMGLREMWGRSLGTQPGLRGLGPDFSEEDFGFLRDRPSDMNLANALKLLADRRQALAPGEDVGSTGRGGGVGEGDITSGPDLERRLAVDETGVDDPISADTVLGTTSERIRRALEAQAEWGRTETAAEREQDEYWAARAQGARDDATSRLYADVAGAIAGSGGVPGGIAKGLKEAIYGQIEQGDLARDYEGLPITAAAARSRYNTYAEQNQALQDIFRAASSRGDIDATIEGRLNEVHAALQESRRLTPDDLVKVRQILRTLFEDGTIGEGELKAWWDQIAMGRMQEFAGRS
jgi:hypothetical protein